MAYSDFLRETLTSPRSLLVLAVVAGSLYLVSQAAYLLFFHPLHSFPGPFSHAISRLPYCRRLLRGTLPFDMLQLHQKYGEVVRIAPDELAFATPAAWKDIMGHRTGGDEFAKQMKFYRPIAAEQHNIVNADREEHGRLRRQMAHGFSDKSMHDQEPLISSYIDLLVKRLHENCAGGAKALNLGSWYNFATFDVIGDLAFGEPFGCLTSSDYHPWVKMIFETAKIGTLLQAMSHYPLLKHLLLRMVPKSMKEKREHHLELTRAKLRRRMEAGERPDLIEGLLKKKEEWNLSIDQLEGNSMILIIGGSETTATLLSGATYLLLMNPHTLAKLNEEVRSTFNTEDEISINSVSRLTYMLACLNEALRMYPPVPLGLPRIVPKGGARIAGYYVPEDTTVAIHQWATYHLEDNFKDPFNFHPERFLDDPQFAADRLEALQPFHIGGRNCLGRNLAYTEMRLILARIIFNFDMRLADESRGWIERQKIYNMWQRGPLNIHLTPVVREEK